MTSNTKKKNEKPRVYTFNIAKVVKMENLFQVISSSTNNRITKTWLEPNGTELEPNRTE